MAAGDKRINWKTTEGFRKIIKIKKNIQKLRVSLYTIDYQLEKLIGKRSIKKQQNYKL